MPQVFSGGWLYLFIIIMVISIVRIFFKIRTIQDEAPIDRPVIKVPPVPKPDPELDAEPEEDSLLSESDNLIIQGDYEGALKSLEHLLEDLSPTEDREARGKVLFRAAACHSHLAAGEQRFQRLLRAGEALREAVRLFSPVRFRKHYLRALGQLASLHEDLAEEKNPVENLTQSARTCETAAASAREGGMVVPEAMFLTRSGNAYSYLASYGEPQVNLRKAADTYEKAIAAFETVNGEGAIEEKMKVLKMLGDTMASLAGYFQKGECLARAVKSYDGALELMDETKHYQERCAVLTNSGSVLLELYDLEKSPAYLRQALRYSRDALGAAKGGVRQLPKGLAMAVMGDALTRYAEVKDRLENLEMAIKLYETALGIIKDGEEPAQRERIRESLAETVRKIGEIN